MNKLDYELILKKATELPMVRIEREKFLRDQLKKHFLPDIIDQAVEYNPAHAGISTEEIDKIAITCINYETLKVSCMSFVAGLPGGIGMIGSIPADLVQYFGHIIRILQKLAYLYGWEDFFSEDGRMDDGAANIITLFFGVMFGVNEASQIIAKISVSVAQKANKDIARKALTKGMIYPIVKKIAQILGIKMTKEIFAKGVAKVIPIIGGFVTATLTRFTYKPMAEKLKIYLADLPCADVNFCKNRPDACEPIDVEFNEEVSKIILENLDSEIKSEEKELIELEKEYSADASQSLKNYGGYINGKKAKKNSIRPGILHPDRDRGDQGF